MTADLEAGYGLGADELVAGLLEAGAVGLNQEDTDHTTGRLADPAAHAERLAAIKDAGRRAGVDVVLNARVDPFLRAAPDANPDAALGVARVRFGNGLAQRALEAAAAEAEEFVRG